MVTNEVERGRIKCHRYWPDPAHGGPEKMSFGQHIEVVHKSSEEKPDWTVRRFGVKFNGKERTITHIMYTSWPDHGVPTSSAELFQLREEVAASSTVCVFFLYLLLIVFCTVHMLGGTHCSRLSLQSIWSWVLTSYYRCRICPSLS